MNFNRVIIFKSRNQLNLLLISIFSLFIATIQAQDSTWAEKLGFPKGKKIVILHVDDVGMSWESNQGAIGSMKDGVATSCSMMMPCPWIPGYFKFLKNNPTTDAGLHLTLTSEWKEYRWGPLSGKKAVPGLVDSEGAMWSSVEEVVTHASAAEVEMEIRAQIERSKSMGFEPTHLDSHMGTLFASPAFLEKYIAAGIEFKIPVMFPGGHNTLITKQMGASFVDPKTVKMIATKLWESGLPVIDDLHNTSYSLGSLNLSEATTEKLRETKTAFYINALKEVKPGITFMIMHCTIGDPHFSKISDSGKIREADYLAMTSPALKAFIQREGIILTTMRELMERRKKIQKP